MDQSHRRKEVLVVRVGQDSSEAGVSTLGKIGSVSVTETETEPIKEPNHFIVSETALSEDTYRTFPNCGREKIQETINSVGCLKPVLNIYVLLEKSPVS